MSSMTYYYQHARRDQNKIALTFDDGPNPLFTRKVMEILAAKGVRGTFFMIGSQVETERKVVEEVLAAGHVIGNHTYSHPKGWEDHGGLQFWLDELDHAEQVIRGTLPRPTTFFRLPYGAFTPEVNAALRTWIGPRRILNGDVSGDDWMHSLEKPLLPQQIINNVFNNPQLGPGSVIIFHDGSEIAQQRGWRPEPMVAALPIIIDALVDRGYQLVGADELEFDTSGAIPLA